MARVRFTANFDFRPNGRSLIAYKAGHRYTVKRACADQAIAAGKAELLETPPRPGAAPTARRRGAGSAT